MHIPTLLILAITLLATATPTPTPPNATLTNHNAPQKRVIADLTFCDAIGYKGHCEHIRLGTGVACTNFSPALTAKVSSMQIPFEWNCTLFDGVG
ncbi:hypothetical protein Vi05172_g8896 [Venturia inaequalis]|nr:hypothetical protein Vi05172_g8896 [Venturia inaequalis]